jgi:hypothetical protein
MELRRDPSPQVPHRLKVGRVLSLSKWQRQAKWQAKKAKLQVILQKCILQSASYESASFKSAVSLAVVQA